MRWRGLTRDIYDKFVRPKASEREKTWFGRAVIIVATLYLWIVTLGKAIPTFNP